MKDWKAMAKASGIEIDSVEPLEVLEAAFHPLVKDLAPGVEPATGWRLEEDGE